MAAPKYFSKSDAAVDSIDPTGDPRVTHEHAELNGRNYHYLHGKPKGNVKGTIFLIHGWPDLSMGWRNQIPAFLEIGLQVVAPDLLGFGRTDAPEDVKRYSFKQVSGDLKALADKLGVSRIIACGHDWGGAVVPRLAARYPQLVTHVISICTPYFPPPRQGAQFVDLKELVDSFLPNFKYQLVLRSGDVEKHIQSRDQIRQFLNGLYDGIGPDGETGFTTADGPLFDNLPKLAQTQLVDEKTLDWYADEYSRSGIGPTLNWYRTSEVNFYADQDLPSQNIEQPFLFILAERDQALPPSMSQGMGNYVPKLTRKSIDASHWAMWEQPAEVNGILRDWIEKEVFEATKSSL